MLYISIETAFLNGTYNLPNLDGKADVWDLLESLLCYMFIV